ncbi:MAG: hypothetical protein U0872_02740 [Planctomycetaceae bacterium]
MSDGVYQTMRQTEEWNDRIGELNRRAGRILAEVSGEPASDNPRTWWSWWDRMTGVDWFYDKPVDYEYQTQETTRPYAVVVPERNRQSQKPPGRRHPDLDGPRPDGG